MAFQDQGSFLPGTPVTWSGKDEETFVVRIIMIKKDWWVMFEGGPRWRRQGSPRPLTGPGPLHHLSGHWVLGSFSVSCPVYGLGFQF